MSLSEVSNIMWRERRLLELLAFKLEEEHFVLASGRTRWLSHTTREVEAILEEIKRVELERAMAVAGSADELAMFDTPSLRELAAIASPPWNGILAEHRRALLLLTDGIDAITESNRDMLQRGQQASRAACSSTGEVDINSFEASPESRCGSDLEQVLTQMTENGADVDFARVLTNPPVQETTYQAALTAVAKAVQPSLAAFLQ